MRLCIPQCIRTSCAGKTCETTGLTFVKTSHALLCRISTNLCRCSRSTVEHPRRWQHCSRHRAPADPRHKSYSDLKKMPTGNDCTASCQRCMSVQNHKPAEPALCLQICWHKRCQVQPFHHRRLSRPRTKETCEPLAPQSSSQALRRLRACQLRACRLPFQPTHSMQCNRKSLDCTHRLRPPRTLTCWQNTRIECVQSSLEQLLVSLYK